MTTLKERLHADVVAHMKDRNKIALATVRNVLGEIETREKSGKTPMVLDDAQVTSLLQRKRLSAVTPPGFTPRPANLNGQQPKSLKLRSLRRIFRRP